jgi:hypothetical protein
MKGDAGAIAVLIHAADAVVLDDEFLGDEIACAQLDHQMAAAAATGAGREIGVRVDTAHADSLSGVWRLLA